MDFRLRGMAYWWVNDDGEQGFVVLVDGNVAFIKRVPT